MYFSEIVEQLACGSWGINENSQLVYEILKSPLKIEFFTERAKLSVGDNDWDISLTELADFSFEDFTEKNDEGENIEMSKMFFQNQELYTVKSEKMKDFRELAEKFKNLFTDEAECSPKNQVKQLIEEFSLNANDIYNADLYKLLLVYNKRLETALNNGFFHENSKIIVFLEEDCGEIVSNLGQTAKKSFGRILSGGFGGLLDVGVSLVKSAGSRIAKEFISNQTSSRAFMLLTDKNVLLAKPDEINEYDFDDASEIFQARSDETLAGVVDIYDDCENKVLDNIAQTKWNLFKTQLRKIKKEAEQSALDSGNMNPQSEEIDEFAEAEKKITKLKKMLDSGLISQEDFDKKKADILSTI